MSKQKSRQNLFHIFTLFFVDYSLASDNDFMCWFRWLICGSRVLTHCIAMSGGVVELQPEGRKQTPRRHQRAVWGRLQLSRVRSREFALLLLLDQKPTYRHLQLCHVMVLNPSCRASFGLSVPPVWTRIWRGLWRYWFTQQGPCKVAASARQALLKSLSQILVWKKSAELQCHQ